MVSIGIIGTGIMGRRMLSAIRENAADVVHLAGVWDPQPQALAGMEGVPVAASLQALIAEADCIYIASPPGSHIPLSEQALAAGRAVFCEKPLATDTAAAGSFLARLGTGRMAINFPMASSLAVARLQQWIAEGAVGTPESLEIAVAFATWPRNWQAAAAEWLDARAEGGFTREVVSHFLFLTGRVLGPTTVQSASLAFPDPTRSERRLEARLTAGTTPVTLRGTVGEITAEDHNLWTLKGSAGAIRLRDWSIAERWDGTAWQTDPDALPNARMRPLVLRRQLEGVVRMTNGQSHNLATVKEAYDVQIVVEALLAQA